MIDIDKLIRADRATMREFVDMYKRPLYAFIYQMIRDHDITDDLVQEVFIKVFKNIGKLKDRSLFKSWVFRIANNATLTELAKRKKLRTEPIDENAQFAEAKNHYNVSFKHALEESLNHLNPTQKIVFTLRHVNGNSTRESANILKCSEGHIKKQLYLAIHEIRKKMLENYPDMDWDII